MAISIGVFHDSMIGFVRVDIMFHASLMNPNIHMATPQNASFMWPYSHSSFSIILVKITREQHMIAIHEH